MIEFDARCLDNLLRQYCHNDGTPGFVFGYEAKGTEQLVDRLRAAMSAVTAERDRLQAALSAPGTITTEPAGDYDNLRKQFLSLRMRANSNAKMVSHWRDQCGRETRETLLANAASVNAERDTNSMLTDALEAAEAERDQLRAEVEALRNELAGKPLVC